MIENWPQPPLVEHLLFESPWAIVVTLAAVAAVLFIAGGRSEKLIIQKLAIFPLLLAVAAPVLAANVVTDREQLEIGTRSLVDAATAHPVDLAAIETLLADPAALFTLDRDEILAMIRRARDRYDIESNTITLLRTRIDTPATGQSVFTALTRLRSNAGAFPTKTRWLLHWSKTPAADADAPFGPWRVTQLELLRINDRPARASHLP